MTYQIDFPEKFLQIKNKVIENAYLDVSPPEDIKLIYEWLSVEGWDDLLGDLDSWAINLDCLAQLKFDDNELKYYLEGAQDIESLPVTNEMRLNYARELIDYENMQGELVSIKSYKLERTDGKFAYIGCYIETQGQFGAVPKWCGTFKSKEDFIDYIKNSGFIFADEFTSISDEKILKLWKKDIVNL